MTNEYLFTSPNKNNSFNPFTSLLQSHTILNGTKPISYYDKKLMIVLFLAVKKLGN